MLGNVHRNYLISSSVKNPKCLLFPEPFLAWMFSYCIRPVRPRKVQKPAPNGKKSYFFCCINQRKRDSLILAISLVRVLRSRKHISCVRSLAFPEIRLVQHFQKNKKYITDYTDNNAVFIETFVTCLYFIHIVYDFNNTNGGILCKSINITVWMGVLWAKVSTLN